MHAILAEEAAEILALYDEWGEVDRSHRKLAHRGSYLGRVWVSPSTVRRVLHVADLHFRPRPRPGKSAKKPFPDWADYRPNSIWIYDTTHFTKAGMAVLIIEDLVSRKWITEIVSCRGDLHPGRGRLHRRPRRRGPLRRHRRPRRSRSPDAGQDESLEPVARCCWSSPTTDPR